MKLQSSPDKVAWISIKCLIQVQECHVHHLVFLLVLLRQQPGGMNGVNSATSFDEATLIGCDSGDVFHDFQDVANILD